MYRILWTFHKFGVKEENIDKIQFKIKRKIRILIISAVCFNPRQTFIFLHNFHGNTGYKMFSLTLYYYILSFLLLSKHILCKERIVIVKKFDFKILTYSYVFRSPEFIYAIFTVMYVCMCVCVYVCVCEWTR